MRRTALTWPAAPIAVAAIAFVAAGGAGCAPPVRHLTMELQVAAHSDDDRPLPAVTVYLDDRSLGETDGRGLLQARVEGVEGARFRLTATCPAGHLTPDEVRTFTLGAVRPLQTGGKLTFPVRCERRERAVAVLLRARATEPAPRTRRGRRVPRDVQRHARAPTPLPDLPVMFQGAEVGRTDASGLLHLALQAEPRSTVELTVDTSAHVQLRPANPTLSFAVTHTDEVFTFDRTFVTAPPEKKRQRRPRREEPPEPPHRIRILNGGARDPILHLH